MCGDDMCVTSVFVCVSVDACACVRRMIAADNSNSLAQIHFTSSERTQNCERKLLFNHFKATYERMLERNREKGRQMERVSVRDGKREV